MARRTILTARQREALFTLPVDEPVLMRHCILSEADLAHVRRRRRSRNRLGFALQLCAFRYPGRLLQPGELIPSAMLAFVGGQLGLTAEDMVDYATRSETHYEHSAALQRLYGYRPFEGLAREEMAGWLMGAAEAARTNEALAIAMVEELRRRHIIVPAATTIERACADALVAAERRIIALIAGRLDDRVRDRLTNTLRELVEGAVTRFVWLRRHEAGNNSSDATRLLDRLEWIEDLKVPSNCLTGIPVHRVARLRRQGERYYADGLRDLPETRRIAILAVCAIEWRASVIDALVETHDRVVGKLYRDAERMCAARIADQKADVAATLRSFAQMGSAMVAARVAGTDLHGVIDQSLGWAELERLTVTAEALTATIVADPLDHVAMGYARFRRYAPRMLEALELKGGRSATPLLMAVEALRTLNRKAGAPVPGDAPIEFARPKWRKRLDVGTGPDRRTWETAILFTLRDALRSGDIWLPHSHRHREIGTDLVPLAAVGTTARLAVPLNAAHWIESRTAMQMMLKTPMKMRTWRKSGRCNFGDKTDHE